MNIELVIKGIGAVVALGFIFGVAIPVLVGNIISWIKEG